MDSYIFKWNGTDIPHRVLEIQNMAASAKPHRSECDLYLGGVLLMNVMRHA